MRFVLYFFAVLLLTPLLFAGTIWVRSFRVSDELSVDLARRDGTAWSYARHGLFTGRGTLVYYRRGWTAHRASDNPPPPHFAANAYRASDPTVFFAAPSKPRGRWGFAIVDELWAEVGARALIIPFWAPTLLSAILAFPALVLARRVAIRSFRQKSGLCLRCGYDLRESNQRCPECGHPFKPRQIGKSLSPAPVS